MTNDAWKPEVVTLLERCSASLKTGHHRQAVSEFGMAAAYLVRASRAGDPIAELFVAQFLAPGEVESTQRFSFIPGELERLTGQKCK